MVKWGGKKINSYVLFLLYVLMHCRSFKNLTQQEDDVAVSLDFKKSTIYTYIWTTFEHRFLYKLDKMDIVMYFKEILSVSV